MLARRFVSDTNIIHKGKALDIGFGHGRDALALAQAGYTVEGVDKNNSAVRTFSEKLTPELDITVSHGDVRTHQIEKDAYSVILASNVLFFIEDQNEVYRLLEQFIAGLINDGYLLFSLLGPNDGWKDKEKMSFFEYSDVLNFLQSKPVGLYFRSTEEGYGPMMSGETKYWHLHRFIVQKNDGK